MKNDVTVKELFDGMIYIKILERIGIFTLSQLRDSCVGKKKTYVPLPNNTLSPSELQNLNWVVARELRLKKLIHPIEEIKQHALSCYLNHIKTRSIKALRFHNIRTVGNLMDKCLDKDQFVVIKGKNIGSRANYEAASILKHLNFISEEVFNRVPLPSWRTRLLSDEEIGEDGALLLSSLVVWSQSAIEVITHAVTLKFRKGSPRKREWTSITLGELVKTFVRINSENTSVLYLKGHIGSHWYSKEWFIANFDAAFLEIETVLKEYNFL